MAKKKSPHTDEEVQYLLHLLVKCRIETLKLPDDPALAPDKPFAEKLMRLQETAERRLKVVLKNRHGIPLAEPVIQRLSLALEAAHPPEYWEKKSLEL